MTATATTDEGLRRGLTRWHALAVVLGAVIGTGIFIRPASIAQLVHTPPAIAAVWLVAGLVSVLGALTYADLAARLPRSGGEYAYLRFTLGEGPAFLFGWMRLTLGATTMSALAVAFTVFLADLFPLGGVWWRLHPPFVGPAGLQIGARQVIAVLLIALLAALNVRGVRDAGRFQSAVTTIKVLGLVGLIVAIVIAAPAHGAATVGDSPAWTDSVGPSAFGAALLAALGSYNGWAHVTMIGGEVRDPERSLPWALVLGISTALVIYLAANFAYLHSLSMQEIVTANSTAHPTAASIASRAAVAALGPRSATILTVLFLVASLGSLHCNLLAVPRVFFAMARDGLMPQVVAHVTPHARTPNVAILTLASVGAIFAVLGSYDRLTNMSSFGYLLFYALNTLGYLVARNRLPVAPGRRGLPLGIPALFLVSTVTLIVTVIAGGTTEVVASLILIALGIPAFLIFRLRRRLKRPSNDLSVPRPTT